MSKVHYQKPAYSHAELLAFLEQKNLHIPDHEYARHCLAYIGYYRLKIYMRPFEDKNRQFHDGIKFDDIVDLYDFDRELRLVCLDAIERIEVALRAQIVDIMSSHGGPHFYYDSTYFTKSDIKQKICEVGKNGQHISIRHYHAKYDEPELPPIWSITEEITFGKLSIIYAKLQKPYRKQIARNFGMQEPVCVSWFRSLTIVRNICAHHGRLWNFPIKVHTPKVPKSGDIFNQDNTSIYSRLVLMKQFLDQIDAYETHGWKDKLSQVISSRPERARLIDMGFPEEWETTSIWAR